jgi:predicted nucleotidyltransferase
MNVENSTMNAKSIKEQLYHDVPLRILSFVSVQQGVVLSAEEVRRALNISSGATNQTLRLLHELNVVTREKKGNVFLYRVNPDNHILKQFKIFENVIFLRDMVEVIKKYCREIILFGSCADGTNAADSDIDVYILTDYKDKVHKTLHKYKTGKPLKPIIADPLELAELKDKDKVFYGQIMKGITMWKGKPEYEGI